VKALPGTEEMETTLIRGSIRVDSKKYPGSFAILKPNEKLTVKNNLSQESAALQTPFHIAPLVINRDTNRPQDVKWVQNRLEIENEPLSSIATKLQSWYGVEIVITDDAVKDYHYSGVFENESILKTLEALQLSYPFQFKVEENKIIISK
jgi:transmembrane sensor